jgi:hypothetical protein
MQSQRHVFDPLGARTNDPGIGPDVQHISSVTIIIITIIAVDDLSSRTSYCATTAGYLRVILPSGEERHYGDPVQVAAARAAPPGTRVRPLLAVDPAEGEAAARDWECRPQPRATMRVFRMDFFRRVVTGYDTGMGEAYMDKVGPP